MHNIGVEEGQLITLSTADAVPGTYALFQPQTPEFEDITNKTALLENALRNFSCITKGEILVLHYNNRIYELKIVDTKPGDVLNIINCDLNVRNQVFFFFGVFPTKFFLMLRWILLHPLDLRAKDRLLKAKMKRWNL